jgi:uncharacterized protein
VSIIIVQRSLELDDIVVERTDEGRVIIARALSYGMPYRVSDDGGGSFYEETWRAGVFTKSIKERAGRIPLLTWHDRRKLPIGATVGMEDSSSDFIFRAKVSRTRDGDEALELIRDGALTGVSVGARVLQQRRQPNGGVERLEAALLEISLAPAPFVQMPDAGVLAVRALSAHEGDETTDEAAQEPTPSLDAARAILTALDRP